MLPAAQPPAATAQNYRANQREYDACFAIDAPLVLVNS
jgi:hypothetical protein